MPNRYLVLFAVFIFTILLTVSLVGRSPSTHAQDEQFRILLPNVMDHGELGAEVREVAYAVLIGPRETLRVTMTRTSGNVIPYLRLYKADGEFITEERPDGDDATEITLSFQTSQPGWYFVVATSKESVRFEYAEGSFSVIQSGTTYRPFEALGLEIPPRIENVQIFTGSDELVTIFNPTRRFLVKIPTAGALTLQANINTINIRILTPTERELINRISNNVSYPSNLGEWVIFEVGSDVTTPITLTVTLTDESGDTVATEPVVVSRLPTIQFEGQTADTAQATALPTRGPTCEVTALDNASRRSGPGTQYSVESALRYGSTRTVIAQSTDASNWTWWQLEDKSWVREDLVSEGPGCELVALLVLEATFEAPTAAAGTEAPPLCILTAISDGNKRIGPGVDYQVGAALLIGTKQQAIGKFEPRGRQDIWWQTEDGLWVREDVVEEEGACDDLEVTWPR